MKKMCFSILVLSLLLAILTACGAQAKQPDEPEPAPQADQIELSQPVQLSEPEKTEISQEELEAIFETVYTTASENHPEDWSVEFCISDEIGKINSAIPDDKKAPVNLRTLYTDWRTERTAPEPEPEPVPEPEPEPVAEEAPAPVALPTFDDCNETVYATSTVNVRSGPGTSYNKLGSLNWGDGVTRTGIGTGDYSNWSRIEYSNGTVAYVSSNYLSTTKPVAQQSTPSSSTSQNNNTSSSSNTSSNDTSYTPSWVTLDQSKYPAGTIFTVGGETYTSLGSFSCNFVVSTNSYGERVLVNPKTGTEMPCVADQNVDLGDGGQRWIGEEGALTHTEEGSEGFYG